MVHQYLQSISDFRLHYKWFCMIFQKYVSISCWNRTKFHAGATTRGNLISTGSRWNRCYVKVAPWIGPLGAEMFYMKIDFHPALCRRRAWGLVKRCLRICENLVWGDFQGEAFRSHAHSAFSTSQSKTYHIWKEHRPWMPPVVVENIIKRLNHDGWIFHMKYLEITWDWLPWAVRPESWLGFPSFS